MSRQLTDPFIWRKQAWVFLGADDSGPLFDPKQYGLSPDAPATCCWKGFVVGFSVREGRLYLDELSVYCKNGIYPPINRTEAGPPDDLRMRTYRNLNMELSYSGRIVVGKQRKPCLFGRAFSGPRAYGRISELTFENGKLVDYEDRKPDRNPAS